MFHQCPGKLEKKSFVWNSLYMTYIRIYFHIFFLGQDWIRMILVSISFMIFSVYYLHILNFDI